MTTTTTPATDDLDLDLATCDDCGARDETVSPMNCAYDDRDLCDECRPSHRACPDCDPDYYRDLALDR